MKLGKGAEQWGPYPVRVVMIQLFLLPYLSEVLSIRQDPISWIVEFPILGLLPIEFFSGGGVAFNIHERLENA
jgi:hypothetical protein